MGRFAAPWGEALAAAERWLLPGECLLCQERAAADALVCPVCRSRWRRIPDPVCPRCGQPADRETACRICLDWPPGFGGVQSAVWLDDRARRAVHLLKYEGWWRVATSMGQVMAGLPTLTAGTTLVPIPLGAARARGRGYNQSAKLAEALGLARGLRVDAGCLVRVRETGTQTRLTPEERAANLRAAFQAGRRVPARVVLVDDVFTTGATLVSAAAALVAAGCREVRAVTFARAEPPLAALARPEQ